MKPRRNEPDWCTTRLGRLQQDGDGRLRFIQRAFGLVLWHQRGCKVQSVDCLVNTNHQPFKYDPIPISIGQKFLFHSFHSHICRVLIPKVQHLPPLRINRQHVLVAFAPSARVRPLLCVSIHLSVSIHSNLFILRSLSGITGIGDGVAFWGRSISVTRLRTT